MTASQIGSGIGVLPAAVYRSVKPLVALGVVQELEGYPIRYRAVSTQVALPFFLLQARQSFLEAFGPDAVAASSGPTISIIRNREELFSRTDHDAAVAQQSINFIVSGLEVPDSTVLAYRKARSRNVPIRALVQRRKETSKEKLEQWQKIGVDVRQTNNLGLRLFVIDARVVYLTSYSQDSKNQAFGIRFDYASIALAMDELFEEKWGAAKAV